MLNKIIINFTKFKLLFTVGCLPCKGNVAIVSFSYFHTIHDGIQNNFQVHKNDIKLHTLLIR